MNKTAIDNIAKHILVESQSIAEKDTQAAEIIRPELEQIFKDIEDVVYKRITKSISSFNSPGFIMAFLEAIKSGIVGTGRGFDANKAKARLKRWFDHG